MASIDNIASQLSKIKVEAVNELSFANRNLKLDCAADAQEIVDAIKNCSNLQALRLEGNTLGLDASVVIAEALKEKKEFERALWSDMYTGRLRSEIPPSLEHLGDGIIAAGAHLNILDLSDNAFGPDGVKGIKKLLMSSACYSLETLKLNNNGLGIGGGKLLSEAFISCYNSSKSSGTPSFALKVFISGRNRLENEGSKALSEAFKIIGSLEEITMPQNGIQPEGIKYLAEAFQANKNLKIVNINDNTCTERGAKALAKCIPHLKNLETLNVGDCLLKDSGALALASALQIAIPSLKQVIASYNEIRRDGAIAIANSMENKDGLEILNLDGNQLGDSVSEVKEAMQSFGRGDALASFDDNEEPDSDDDEETEEETEDLEVKGTAIVANGTHNEESTIGDVRQFIKYPALKDWQKMNRNQRKTLVSQVVKEDLLQSGEKVAKAFVWTCHALAEDKQSVEEVADAILETSYTDGRCNTDEIIAGLLIHLGLIKSEVKVEKVDNLRGPLEGLRSVVLKEYFPRKYTTHLIAFLMKSNVLLDRCPSERHELLQTLYQK